MLNLIIVAGILVVIMLIFMFILFKNIIKRMNDSAKRYFINKMKDYDYILEEKQDKLEEIKQEIKELESEHRNILKVNDQEDEDEKETDEDINVEVEKAPIKQAEEIKYNLNVPEYRETRFFDNYKEVRKTFTVNNEKIIKDFVKEHKNLKEEKEYNSLKKIRHKFNDESIYDCLTLSSDDQIKVLDESLTKTEKNLINFDTIIKKEDFDIKDLITLIDDRMEQIDPTIYIYTNVLDDKYKSIDSNISLKHYNNMSEGIIIKYKNKIYDYSI